VRAQSREVSHGPGELGVDLHMQYRIEALPFECLDSRPLVEEETHFGDEADVREGDIASHQELAVRSQRLVDSSGVDRESVTSSRVDLGRDYAVAAFACMTGALILARAVDHKRFSDQILETAAKRIIGGGRRGK